MQRKFTPRSPVPLPMTGTQKDMIESVVRFYIDPISELKDPADAIAVFKALLNGDEIFENERKKYDDEGDTWSQAIKPLKNILTHPNPQNRSRGNPMAVRMQFRSQRFSPEQIENGTWQGRVYYLVGDNIVSEPEGLLGLNTQESETPITREAVVTYINSLMIDKINELIINKFQTQGEEKKDSVAAEAEKHLKFQELKDGYRFVKYQSGDKRFGYLVDSKGEIVNLNMVSFLYDESGKVIEGKIWQGNNLDKVDPCKFLGRILAQLNYSPPELSDWSLLKEMKAVIKNSNDLIAVLSEFNQKSPPELDTVRITAFCNYFLSEKDLAKLVKNSNDFKKLLEFLSPPLSKYILSYTQYNFSHFVKEMLQKNDIALLNTLLQEKKLSLTYTDGNGDSLVHLAAIHHQPEILKLLVDYKIDLDKRNSKGQTAVELAVQENQADLVRILAEYKANMSLSDTQNVTPLMTAISNQKFEMVQVLLEHNACIDPKEEKTNRLPLHYAASLAGTDCLDYFLKIDKSAVDCLDRDGRTPLSYAAQHSQINPLKKLIEYKADINHADNNGETVAIYAVKGGNINVISFLLENKSDFYQANHNGKSAVQVAYEMGNAKVMEFLAQHDIDFFKVTQDAISPIEHALQNKQWDALRAMLNAGPSLSSFSSLHFAASMNNSQLMAMALKLENNINLPDNDGQTPLFIAVSSNSTDMVKMVLENKADTQRYRLDGISPIHLAYKVKPEIVDLLHHAGANLNLIKTPENQTPLHFAAKVDNVLIFEKLRSLGADLSIKDAKGDTPICTAIKEGSIHVMNYCVERKENLAITDGEGNTLAQIAVKNNQPEILLLLAEHGADLTVKTKDGMTLAQIAAQNGNYDILNILNQYKVGLSPTDPQGMALVRKAVQEGNADNLIKLHQIGIDIHAAEEKGKDLIQVALENELLAKQKFEKSDLLIDREQLGKKYHNYSQVLKILIMNHKNHDFYKEEKNIIFAYHHKKWDDLALMLISMKKPDAEGQKKLFENYYFQELLAKRDNLTRYCIEEIKQMDYEQRKLFVNEILTGDNLFNLLLNKRDKISSKLRGAIFGGETDKILRFKLFFPQLISHEESKADMKLEVKAIVNADEELKLFEPHRLQNTLYQLGLDTKSIYDLQDVISPSGWLNIAKKVSAKKFPDYDAWMLCCIGGEPQAIKYALSEYSHRGYNNESPLYYACVGGNRQGIEFLIDKGYSLKDCKSKNGITALCLAVNNEDLELTKLFVEKYKLETKEQKRCATNSGITPLHIAASKGNVPLMEYLLSRGMQPSWLTNKSSTPLHEASENGNIDAIKLLIKHDKEKLTLNQLNTRGEAPLHLAIKNKSVEAVKFLLEQGAVIDDKAFEYAKKYLPQEVKAPQESKSPQGLFVVSQQPQVVTILSLLSEARSRPRP